MKEIVVGKMTKEESNKILIYRTESKKIVRSITLLAKRGQELEDYIDAEITKVIKAHDLPKYRKFVVDHKNLEIRAELYDWEKDINVPEDEKSG